jgi:hypothetical protein
VYDEWWTTHDEARLRKGWSLKDDLLVQEATHGSEKTLWRKSLYLFDIEAPYLLPDGVKVFTDDMPKIIVPDTNERIDPMHWPYSLCEEFNMLICSLAFRKNYQFPSMTSNTLCIVEPGRRMVD